MRIGIVLVLNPSKRGIDQYSIIMTHALSEWKDDGYDDEFIVLKENNSKILSAFPITEGWEIRPLSPPQQISAKKISLDPLGTIGGTGCIGTFRSGCAIKTQ